jgi:hypothetical protein
MEDFAFPFWLDIVLIPLCRVEEKEWPSAQRGPNKKGAAISQLDCGYIQLKPGLPWSH